MPPDPLTLQDAARLATLIAQVLADENPTAALGQQVADLDQEQQPAFVAALYESLCYRVDVREYWLQYRMWKVYQALGPARADAAFAHAAAVARMHPEGSGSGQAFRDMFAMLRRQGRDRDALALFRYQMQHLPDQPAAEQAEIAEICRRLEPAATAPEPVATPSADTARVHPVFPAQDRPPWSCALFGRRMPYALAPLMAGMHRPAIAVTEFTDAEVLLHRNAIVVLDQAGAVREASSVAEFPHEIRAWFDRQEALGHSFPVHEAEEAVLLSDRYAIPNICHALLDHLTRLAIYQRLGVDTGTALVIAPEARLPAQREILQRAGVTAHLGTDRIARVRARRLWVSSNCRDLRHAAHLGAPWAVGFIQATLGGRGTKGWRRLYLSRADAAVRRVTNEAEVVALLEPHGFEAMELGRMPYAAQIAAFKQASHVIAPHGAGLTHLVLCPPGAQVLEIFHPLYSNPAFAMQVAAAGLCYAAMLGRDWQSDAPEWSEPSADDIGSSRFLDRHMRVDLGLLSRYLATLT